MKILPELLEADLFSEKQMAIFVAEWPEGMEVTPESVMRAQKIGFDWERVVHLLASPDAWAAYSKAKEPLTKAHGESVALAHQQYEEAKVAALKIQDEACAEATELYRTLKMGLFFALVREGPGTLDQEQRTELTLARQALAKASKAVNATAARLKVRTIKQNAARKDYDKSLKEHETALELCQRLTPKA